MDSHGSVVGPLLFNAFINDLFLIDLESEICNFGDDNTVSTRSKNLEEVIIHLKDDLYTTCCILCELKFTGHCIIPVRIIICFPSQIDARCLFLAKEPVALKFSRQLTN